jgi:ketosteroid isomerase-like protein
MSTGNIELVRRGYEAWNRGDLGGVLELVDPEFEWEPVEIPWSGTMRTRGEFVSYLKSLGRIWETFRLEPEELREIGDAVLVVVLERARGRASGVEVEQRLVHLWSFRNGRAHRMQTFFSTRQALEAVGPPEDGREAPAAPEPPVRRGPRP